MANAKKVRTVDLQAHGINMWQKEEKTRSAKTTADKRATEDRRKKEIRRREEADTICYKRELASYRRQLVRQNGGRKLTRAEKRQSRIDFVSTWN